MTEPTEVKMTLSDPGGAGRQCPNTSSQQATANQQGDDCCFGMIQIDLRIEQSAASGISNVLLSVEDVLLERKKEEGFNHGVVAGTDDDDDDDGSRNGTTTEEQEDATPTAAAAAGVMIQPGGQRPSLQRLRELVAKLHHQGEKGEEEETTPSDDEVVSSNKTEDDNLIVKFSYLDEENESIVFDTDEEFMEALMYSAVAISRGDDDDDNKENVGGMSSSGVEEKTTTSSKVLRVTASVMSPLTTTTEASSSSSSEMMSDEDRLQFVLGLYHATAPCSSGSSTCNREKCRLFHDLSAHVLTSEICQKRLIHHLDDNVSVGGGGGAPRRSLSATIDCNECDPIAAWIDKQKEISTCGSNNGASSNTHSRDEEVVVVDEGIYPPNSNFDPTFVHTRHECNICGICPIVGFRFHAVPNGNKGGGISSDTTARGGAGGQHQVVEEESDAFANFDLCHTCYKRWRENERFLPGNVKFLPLQYSHDRHFVPRNRNGLKMLWSGLARRLPLFRLGQPRIHSQSQTSYLIHHESVNEGIQKSLEELHRKKNHHPKSSVGAVAVAMAGGVVVAPNNRPTSSPSGVLVEEDSVSSNNSGGNDDSSGDLCLSEVDEDDSAFGSSASYGDDVLSFGVSEVSSLSCTLSAAADDNEDEDDFPALTSGKREIDAALQNLEDNGPQHYVDDLSSISSMESESDDEQGRGGDQNNASSSSEAVNASLLTGSFDFQFDDGSSSEVIAADVRVEEGTGVDDSSSYDGSSSSIESGDLCDISTVDSSAVSSGDPGSFETCRDADDDGEQDTKSVVEVSDDEDDGEPLVVGGEEEEDEADVSATGDYAAEDGDSTKIASGMSDDDWDVLDEDDALARAASSFFR